MIRVKAINVEQNRSSIKCNCILCATIKVEIVGRVRLSSASSLILTQFLTARSLSRCSLWNICWLVALVLKGRGNKGRQRHSMVTLWVRGHRAKLYRKFLHRFIYIGSFCVDGVIVVPRKVYVLKSCTICDIEVGVGRIYEYVWFVRIVW